MTSLGATVFDVRDRAGWQAALDTAGPVLRDGQVVVLPTETVYGIAASPAVPGATARLFALKGRTADVPLAVLCRDVDQALALSVLPAGEGGRAIEALAREHWPGPLTLVLPRRPGLGYELGEPTGTIGVRCPDHELVRDLTARVGPLAVTSANRHREPTPDTAVEVAGLFGDGVAAVLDGGACSGLPSTVLDVTGSSRRDWRVLRQGGVRIPGVGSED